jgi:poly(A) polymerase
MTETYPESNSRQRHVEFANLEQDAQRRDFTINMLYKRISDEELRDPSGSSLNDLKNKLIQCHPLSSPESILHEDPLRILRLFRFKSLLKAEIHPSLKKAIDINIDRIDILSGERIKQELMKAAQEGLFENYFKDLAEYQILKKIFPQLLPMINCTQDKIYHSEGDVWTHTLLVLKNCPPNPLIQFAALFHDSGKPETRSEHGDRIKFLGHEIISVEILKTSLAKYRFPEKFIRDASQLVLLHLRGGDVGNWKSLKPARKFLRDAGDLCNELLVLIEADSKASLDSQGMPRLEHISLLKNKLLEASKIPIHRRPILDGNDIMKALAICAGPDLKILMNAIIEAEDDYIAAHQAQWTKDEALKWLKENGRQILASRRS